jgi:ATP-dependent HslUV protease ATP-binding subunit HslU
MVKHEKTRVVEEKARHYAEERLLDLLLPPAKAVPAETKPETNSRSEDQSREKMRQMLRQGKLNDRIVDLEITRQGMPLIEVFNQNSIEELNVVLEEAFTNRLSRKKKKRKITVQEASKYLQSEEAEKLIDMDEVVTEARKRAENSGMIFIDEIDKICGSGVSSGPDVSREGVQRDLLPIVEGSSVMTKYGMVKTDHMLFIAAGAFHNKKPSDLIPELQGRFPIRVELTSLTQGDFRRILVEPENSLSKQYVALLATEGIALQFTEDALDAIAQIAAQVNETTENIGARRLQTIITKLLEELLYAAPKISDKNVIINGPYVHGKLSNIVKNVDLSRYIL